MKRLSLLALLFLFGCVSSALPTKQDSELPSADPFKGANVIYVKTSDDLTTARDKMAGILQLQDYTLSQQENNGPNALSTEPRTFGQAPGSARYFVDLTEEGDSTRLVMHGLWIPNQVSDRYAFEQYASSRVTATGQRRSTSWVSWRNMEELAGSYGGGRVFYDRQ